MSLQIRSGYVGSAIMFVASLVIIFLAVYLTKKGTIKPKIRRLTGVDALDEAIGRATEMGRPVHFTVGLGGVGDVQVIAGLSILQYVARKCAEYGTRLIFTFSDPSVEPVARDLIKTAYTQAGKPEEYKPETVLWLSNRQFAYATGAMGLILREKVAANLLLGYFAAESLILAEAGYRAGAIQIAGTTNSYQIPFFIAACDYTLISEELITAGAYVSKNPEQIGTIFGQDIIRVIGLILTIIGLILWFAGDKTFYTWLMT